MREYKNLLSCVKKETKIMSGMQVMRMFMFISIIGWAKCTIIKFMTCDPGKYSILQKCYL